MSRKGVPDDVLRFLDAQTAVGELHRLAGELTKLVRLKPDDRVDHAIVTAAAEAVGHWHKLDHAIACDDWPEAGRDLYDRFDAWCRNLIDEIAPPLGERPDGGDWDGYAATRTVGRNSTERKLRSLVGKLIADGADPALVRRYAQLENRATAIPPLHRPKVDALVDWVLQREAER